jgi:hypothetical protein
MHSKCLQLEARSNYFLKCYASLISARKISALYLHYEQKTIKSAAYVNASIFNNQAKPQPYVSYQLIKRYRSETRRRIIREADATRNLRRLVLEGVNKTVSAANTFKRQWILQTADNYTWRTLQNVYGVYAYMFVLWELFNFKCDKGLSSTSV